MHVLAKIARPAEGSPVFRASGVRIALYLAISFSFCSLLVRATPQVWAIQASISLSLKLRSCRTVYAVRSLVGIFPSLTALISALANRGRNDRVFTAARFATASNVGYALRMAAGVFGSSVPA